MARKFRGIRFVALTSLVLAAGCSSSADEQEASDDATAMLRPSIDSDGRSVLPNWATEEELAIESRSTPPQPRAETAPLAGYRIPAEYEPVTTVVMTWAGHASVLSGIAVASAAAGANVWMVGGPASIAGVPAARYKSLGHRFNSIWSRDYGPVGINEATHSLGIVDTTYRHFSVRRDDDAMSCRLAADLGAGCHTTNLILDGGNYMSDGKGNVFLTKRVYDWNRTLGVARTDELLKSHLGAKTIHILDYAQAPNGEPSDGTGHLDMFGKLVGDCKVLVAETTVEPYKTVTDKAANYFANLSCGEGRSYEVTRVKGWLSGRTWYTYTNSLIVNKTVIIPFYNNATLNDEAVRAYQGAMPGYTIVGVNSEATIVQGGSIHCITKEIPVVQ